MKKEHVVKTALASLEKAYNIHQDLGKVGEELLQKNQFGETALRGDVEIEKAMVPIRILSEEHGTLDIGTNPQYLGLLDGLDGSSVYKKARAKGRYGTMLGIFSSLDPRYDDYLFSGIMEHATRRLFYAVNGKGSFLIANGKTETIACSKSTELSEKTRIYVDEYFETNRKIFSAKLQGFHVSYLGSSAVYYADLASGSADLVLECTRKRNLEIAIAYGLETESGGVMVTADGRSLGPCPYLEFGHDIQVPVVSAATKELAEALIGHISRNS
ncbi:MAG: hypothetical protein KKA90_02185 [Nanoarchaeota archaeon]|nr:hypothetical protein [Nanoarchaeota archaeon]